jgi:translation initiation factor IF-2
MSEEKAKAPRLFKVAKELNVGSQTLVEFLNNKGYADVQNQPNEKLSEDMYDALLKEFASQRILKEKSEQIKEFNKEQRESIRKQTAPEEEAPRITAEQLKVTLSHEDQSHSDKSETETKPTLASEPVQVVTDIKPKLETDKVSPSVEVKPPAEKPEIIEEVISPTLDKEPAIGLKVVGKIDLPVAKGRKVEDTKGNASKGGKPKADKGNVGKPAVKPTQTPIKSEEAKLELEVPKESDVKAIPTTTAAELPVSEITTTSDIISETVAPATDIPAAAIPLAADSESETTDTTEADTSVIRAKDSTPRLSGLKVMGKIVLPVGKTEKEKKAAADADAEAKRKRKRKRKPTSSLPATGAPSGTPAAKKGFAGNRGGADKPQTPRAEPTDKEIQEKIRNTLADLNKGASRFRQKLRRAKRDEGATRRESEEQERLENSRIIEVTEFLSANELSNLMDVPVNQVIAKCMELGLFVSINQRIEADVIAMIADEFNFQVKFVDVSEDDLEDEDLDDAESLIPRPPIVTVMGHVDHGKTSLLDYVRKANVIAGEAGGITQHIGAYEVSLEDNRKITFLDTPGHEAFTAMRARGAQITDIVIIVVAADDDVMPQTKEAINHAQAAGVPMIFAINKVDKEAANPERIKEQLSQMNILVEDWGGKYQVQEISAKFGQGVDNLLEKVLLEAEILDLKANPERLAKGAVIEAQLDKGRGIVTTILVQTGSLAVGDILVAGQHYGKVKAMMDERGKRITIAGPSTPVQILGLSGAPQAGDKFQIYETEREAREIATRRQQLMREQSIRQQKHITLDEIARRKAIGSFKELNLIVKGDVDGSVEALSDSLLKLSTPEVSVNIILKSVGQISESDVLLASASDAIIIGFQVRPSSGARKLAENEAIDIRLYSIIYDAINEVRDALEGLLAPEIQEDIVASVEVREVFKISKVGSIAGCYVLEGKITRNTPIRLIRDGIVIYSGKLASLKRFKDDAKEVNAHFECGLSIDNYNDIQTGDIIEGYEQKEVKRKLS